jgi:hypothetical protein
MKTVGIIDESRTRIVTMSLEENVVEGTLKPDGTLELDEKPTLEPGRVTVVLRSHAPPTATSENWWQFMQRTRRELEDTSNGTMNEQEMAAHLDWLREEDRIDELLRQESPPSQECP